MGLLVDMGQRLSHPHCSSSHFKNTKPKKFLRGNDGIWVVLFCFFFLLRVFCWELRRLSSKNRGRTGEFPASLASPRGGGSAAAPPFRVPLPYRPLRG